VVDVSLGGDEEEGGGSYAEEEALGSDKALLMGSVAGGASFVDGPIVNWHSYARSFEAGTLALVALLLMVGLGGGDWLHGTNGDLSPVFAGLKSASVGNATGQLREACHPDEPADAVTCAVASAGGWGAGLLTISLLVCFALIVRIVLEEMHSRGMLAVALARLSEKVPLQTFAPLRSIGPTIGWGVLVGSQYIGLLIYAVKSPATLGAGEASLGVSYGLVRLAMICSSLGALAHYAASRVIDDALLLETLDVIKSVLTGLERRPRILQVALLTTLGLEVLRWSYTVGWGGLLPAYGLAAQSLKSATHLALYTCAAAFACIMDVLCLAAAPADPLLWGVLMSKAVGVGIFIRFRHDVI